MADKTLHVNIDVELYTLLERRAKKELCDLDELVSDILRRSMLSYKKNITVADKTDDALVRVFSRQKRGRAVKKKASVTAPASADKPEEPYYKEGL